jgi:hypothetical protein
MTPPKSSNPVSREFECDRHFYCSASDLSSSTGHPVSWKARHSLRAPSMVGSHILWKPVYAPRTAPIR